MKKRVLSCILMVCMVISMVLVLPTAVGAETEGMYEYTVSNGEARISDCDTSISGEVTIPITLGGYLVTQIYESAFADCISLQSVIIPDSIMHIGDSAFANCGNLESVTISDNITYIGSSTFADCTRLATVNIGTRVTHIESDAFTGTAYYNDSSNWTGNVLYIGNYLIVAKPDITGDYVILNNTKVIARSAFATCSNLQSVTIPEGVTHIGSAAFKGCSSLMSVTIPNSVSNIEYYAFRDCPNLATVNLGTGITYIGERAFAGTAYYNDSANWIDQVLYNGNYLIAAKGGITGSYAIRANTKVISSCAFFDCSQLKSVTIPEGVTNLCDNAFFYCTKLESVTIPSSITTISSYAFQRCTSLKSVTIPEGVATIGDHAFYNCTGLESVTIERDVTTIGSSAFSGCTSLQSVTIPEGVTTIDGSAFYNCAALNSVTIPNSVTTIGSSAFSNCAALNSVTIPSGVTTIESNAFYNCTDLESVIIEHGVTTIGYNAFGCCSGLNSVTMPNSITTIESNAFSDCTALESVTIPASVTHIATPVFLGCTNLTNINIDSGNATYCVSDGHIFSKDMTQMIRYDSKNTATEFTIPGTVTTILDNAFFSAELTTIVIPATVQTIAPSAFAGCESLASISVVAENSNYCSDNGVLYNKNKTELIDYPRENTASSYSLPESIITIQKWCFNENKYLQTIVLPSALSYVGEGAFMHCYALDTVLYLGTEQQWQEIDIALYNDALTYASVICEFDGVPARIKTVSCIYDGNSGMLSAKITFDYLLEAGDLVLAIYDNGSLMDVKTQTLTAGDSSASFELEADDNYLDYTAKAFCWDSMGALRPFADSVEANVTEAECGIIVNDVLESLPPFYDEYTMETYTYPGDCSRIEVTFSDDTEIEEDFDCIWIYDAENNLIGQYSGLELSGQTISIPGNTVKIKLLAFDIYYSPGYYRTESIVVYP